MLVLISEISLRKVGLSSKNFGEERKKWENAISKKLCFEFMITQMTCAKSQLCQGFESLRIVED